MLVIVILIIFLYIRYKRKKKIISLHRKVFKRRKKLAKKLNNDQSENSESNWDYERVKKTRIGEVKKRKILRLKHEQRKSSKFFFKYPKRNFSEDYLGFLSPFDESEKNKLKVDIIEQTRKNFN